MKHTCKVCGVEMEYVEREQAIETEFDASTDGPMERIQFMDIYICPRCNTELVIPVEEPDSDPFLED